MPPSPQQQRVTRASESLRQRQRREAAQRLVGSRVAEIREARGLTQAQLAERLNCSMRYFQSIEQGDANLTLGSLTRLAHVLGLEISDLFAPTTRTSRGPGRPGRSKG